MQKLFFLLINLLMPSSVVLDHHAAPEARELHFVASTSGVFNAIAFWHEIDIDSKKEKPLSTAAPAAGACAAAVATKWPAPPRKAVAVQWISRPCHIAAGTCFSIEASHDTFGIHFALKVEASALDEGRNEENGPGSASMLTTLDVEGKPGALQPQFLPSSCNYPLSGLSALHSAIHPLASALGEWPVVAVE